MEIIVLRMASHLFFTESLQVEYFWFSFPFHLNPQWNLIEYCSNIYLGVTVCTICYLTEKKANEHYQLNSLFACYSCPLPKASNSTKMKESDGTAKINNFQTKSFIKLGFYVSKSKITKFFFHCHHNSDWELNDAQGHCHCHSVLKSDY